jgi:hypothetical protein
MVELAAEERLSSAAWTAAGRVRDSTATLLSSVINVRVAFSQCCLQ